MNDFLTFINMLDECGTKYKTFDITIGKSHKGVRVSVYGYNDDYLNFDFFYDDGSLYEVN
jgi:hypothetical protein